MTAKEMFEKLGYKLINDKIKILFIKALILQVELFTLLSLVINKY